MHPAIAQLTPDEAWDLPPSGYLDAWLEARGLDRSPQILTELMERALEVDSVRPRDHPRRRDAQALRDFVDRAAALPYRLREVARLCLVEGLSLRACAERLGIARGTVRVHLRRLRALRRLAAARRSAAMDDVVEAAPQDLVPAP
jgi:DNA-directed RNA polymerase specialized sigma24 family protein